MKTLSRLRNRLSWFWLKSRQRSSVLLAALRQLANAIETSCLLVPQHIESLMTEQRSILGRVVPVAHASHLHTDAKHAQLGGMWRDVVILERLLEAGVASG